MSLPAALAGGLLHKETKRNGELEQAPAGA
jgi:hypothetical protein